MSETIRFFLFLILLSGSGTVFAADSIEMDQLNHLIEGDDERLNLVGQRSLASLDSNYLEPTVLFFSTQAMASILVWAIVFTCTSDEKRAVLACLMLGCLGGPLAVLFSIGGAGGAIYWAQKKKERREVATMFKEAVAIIESQTNSEANGCLLYAPNLKTLRDNYYKTRPSHSRVEIQKIAEILVCLLNAGCLENKNNLTCDSRLIPYQDCKDLPQFACPAHIGNFANKVAKDFIDKIIEGEFDENNLKSLATDLMLKVDSFDLAVRVYLDKVAVNSGNL